MLKYIFIALTLTSTVFAEVPTFKAKKMSCQSLREAFETHKTIKVIFGQFGWSREIFWSTEVEAQRNCPGYKYVEASAFETATGRCKVGYGCESWPENPGSSCRTCEQ